MSIKDFINNHEVDFSKNKVTINDLCEYENKLGISFGEQLKEYILEYGYLGYSNVEMYGINSSLKLESDMVKQTLYLHKYYPNSIGYIALENIGEGDYAVVDCNDFVWELITENGAKLNSSGLKLYDYILSRFKIAI